MTTLEVTRIKGVDAEGVPPCDILLLPSKQLCGRPSAYRIIRTCGCGKKRTHFLCQQCKDAIGRNGIQHYQDGAICPQAAGIRYI